MITNMGTADRIIRLIVAAIIAMLFFTNMISGTIAIVLVVLAVIFALTSAIKFCPLYYPFKIFTN